MGYQIAWRRASAAVAAAAVIASLAACDDSVRNQAGGNGDPIKVYYLQKQGTQDYFLSEAAGARRKAAELRIELVVVDLGNDTAKTIDAVDAAVADKASGIILVVPDPAVGPEVVQVITRANIPLLTSDDQLCANKPNPADCDTKSIVPRVGFSGTRIGDDVGRKAAELYRAAGWKPEETRILAAWKPSVTVCTDRVKSARPAFTAAAGADLDVVEVGTDNTPESAKAATAAVVAANRAVKHWVVWGCNDENVTGAVDALATAGYGPDQVIGVGVNGGLACTVWGAGQPSGLKASLWLDGREVGALSVQSMYEKIKKGTEFQPEAFAKGTMLTPDNYRTSGVTC